MSQPRFLVLAGMIIFAALSRLLPHPWNFTPITAMALFGGAQFSKKAHAFLVPFAALLISDAFIGFYPRMPFIYLTFGMVILIGFAIRKKRGFRSTASAVLLSSILFFIVTNFSVWAFGTLYPKTWGGLMQCYTVAIPYFRNALLGDSFYATLLFGGFFLAKNRFPVLQVQPLVSHR